MTASVIPRNVRPTRRMARVFILAGSALLLVSLLLAILFTGSLPAVAAALEKALVMLNYKLGAIAETEERVYWYISRSSGITAYVVLWSAVSLGLIITMKAVGNNDKLPPVYETHKTLAIISLAFALIHPLILLGDIFMAFTFRELFLPLTSWYLPLWMGLGTVAFYLMLILVISFYMRPIITYRGWRLLHYSTFAAFLMVSLHGIKTGTDSSTLLMKIVYIFCIGSVIALTTIRIIRTLRLRSRIKASYHYVDRTCYKPVQQGKTGMHSKPEKR